VDEHIAIGNVAFHFPVHPVGVTHRNDVDALCWHEEKCIRNRFGLLTAGILLLGEGSENLGCDRGNWWDHTELAD
jgi:hypothetical protein